ncbi:MAG: endolytic transglycosylase MltG [Eubacteriales bacterium]|nr:endolytic transglycosylase MltG [Eubacteriales bacterium]
MRFSRLLKTLIIFGFIILLAGLAFFGFINGYDYVRSQNERFVMLSKAFEANDGESPFTKDMEGAVEIYVPRSADTTAIAKILADNSLITNQTVFKILSKFNGFDGQYQAGTHYLSAKMSYDEIMFTLTRMPKPVTLTFPEGMTYQQMRDQMVANGLKIDVQRMDDLVSRPNLFIDYDFVQEILLHKDRAWPLQGYLWPDTYQFDPNMDEESILRMFLDNTEIKLKEYDYGERASRMGLSMDEVITLASIVQAEGAFADISKIGKVFLNRLNQEMPLESCASINYLRLENHEEPRLWVLNSDLERFRTNPYNTYSHPGLPPGPLNNPGIIAIEGVLWPANEQSWPGANEYLYFCARGDGSNEFAKTLEEHEANIEHYQDQWQKQED